MKERGGKSGGERQSQKFDGRFAPECIDQPRLKLARAVAIVASRAMLAATGRGEGFRLTIILPAASSADPGIPEGVAA